MAELVQEHKFRKDNIEEKKRSRSRKIVGLFLVLLIIIAAIILWRYFAGHTYKGYTVVSELALDGTYLSFCNTGTTLTVCNNDGAKAIDADGNILWEAGYQMDNPTLSFSKSVSAIADIGGTQVCVIAENGIPHSYQVRYPIVKLAVAKQGVTAALLDAGTEDYIQMYDINGELRVDINTKTKTDGFPIDIALSEDGTKLVTLYLTFQGDSLISKVTFYNAGEVGKNYQNNIVGQKSYEGVLVNGIHFLGSNTVCVLLENGFSLYQMKEIPTLLCTKEFKERILDIVCAEDAVVVITENSETRIRTMQYYDLSGKVKASWNNLPEYEKAYAAQNEVILFSPQWVQIYRRNKTIKFESGFDRNLEAMLFGGGKRYFLIDTGRVQTIKLSENGGKDK